MNIYQYLGDLSMLFYGVTVITGAWAIVLLVVWGSDSIFHKHDIPTSTFFIILLFLSGHIYNTIISVFMRSAVINQGFAMHYTLFRSYWWALRLIPELAAIIWLDIIYTFRMIKGRTMLKANGHKTVIIEEGVVEKGKVYQLIIKDAVIKEVR
jgi:hypothetical protein